MKLKGKLTRSEISWILYDVANSAYGLIIMTAIMPIYYSDFIAKGLPEGTATEDWGLANSAAGLLVALLAPFLGAIADVKQSKKVFLGVFMVCGIIFTAMFSITQPGMRMFTLAIYCVSLIAFAGGNVFYDSLLVDTTSKGRMDWISGAGYAWGYIGGAIPYILCIILFAVMSNSGVFVMKTSFIITALWWGIFSIPILKFTHQRYKVKSETGSVGDALKNLVKTFSEIRKYRQVVIFLIAYFLYIDGVDTIIRMAIPYSKDIGLGLSSTTLMLTVLGLQIVAFPFALLYGFLAKFYGAKRLVFIAIVVYMIITFLAFIMPDIGNKTIKTSIFFLLAFLIATSQGGIQALSRSYYGKIIPKEQAAEFFGFYNIFGKFATIFGPFMIAIAGKWLGHIKYGMLSLVILFILGGFMLIFVKEPKGKEARA